MTMDWLGLISDAIGLLGVPFSLLAWIKARQIKQDRDREKQRQNKTVHVILQRQRRANGRADNYEIPVELRRAELTRAEILGRLGMIPMCEELKKQRFSIGYLNTQSFFRRLNEIIDGAGEAELFIYCTDEEFNQFDLSRINQWSQ